MNTTLSTEKIVQSRYAAAAQATEAALCCPVEYSAQYLEVLPQEVIEKDYGCGDPSKYLEPGETVLDLGSGTGKIGFIAAQIVGSKGRVIGVDMTEDMLEVARRNAPLVAEKLGYANVEFRKGRIQDLRLDLEKLDEALQSQPIQSALTFLEAEALAEELRLRSPLVANDSIDVVVSNCVLNLVDSRSKKLLFSEIFRVLRQGGRVIISDIVCDEPVPESLQKNQELWSGCLSGAMTEEAFMEAFAEAGFYGMEWLQFQSKPWQIIEGIEFRSATIQAFKGKQGPCWERNQAVIYKGPFREVLDDDGHRMERGRRYAVCDKTYQLYQKAPYASFFEAVDPLDPIALEDATPFPCERTPLRHPQETKGQAYRVTTEASSCCSEGDCC